MRNLYLILLLAFCSFANAQIVNIPDPVFKNMLVNTLCTSYNPETYTATDDVDTNNDGEIQVSESLAVSALLLVGIEPFEDIDMTGIAAFSNLESLFVSGFDHLNADLSGNLALKYLDVEGGTITALNLSGLNNLQTFRTHSCNYSTTVFSGLPSLETFNFYNGTIESLGFSNLPNLKEIIMEGPELQDNNILSTITFDDLPSLERLECNYLGLTSLDVSGLTNLTTLACSQNQLNSLDVSNLTQLVNLGVGRNNLTTLDLTNLPNLTSLSCEDNQLTALDITQNPNLIYFYCYSNQLTDLDLSNSAHLSFLYCGNNQLTELNTTNLLNIRWINVRNNLFTTLDFSYSNGANWKDLDFSNNPNLTYLNIKNGARFSFHQFESFDVNNCPNLQYICADEFNFDEIDAPQAQVSSYCSFTPGGNFNTISGTLTFDVDNNGCDTGDVLSLNSKMKISTQFSEGVTFADASGHYMFYTQGGNFTVTPEFESPYFTVLPASATINFAVADGSIQTQNFCITPNGVHNDVEITLVPVLGARPGFNAAYRLVYKNKGNQVASGSIDFTFDDAVLDLVWASRISDSQTLNNLSWNYENLLPFETRTIDVVLNVNSPQEVPSVNLGDTLNFSASINPISGDETPADNTFALAQTVIGSYDPNDKTCLEGDYVDAEIIGAYLHYLIRFQNSGTAAAENIVVSDAIDTQKFDIGSLQLVGSSHPHVTRINGNKVEFIFEGINLPTEQDDEPLSHGFVAFKIKTKADLGVGSLVSNKADIFFDYNFPITTNTATSVFQLLARNQFEDTSVALFPNPVKDVLTIAAKDKIKSIELYDVMGRLIETNLQNTNRVRFDVSQKSTGVYFVKINTERGSKTEKIIKE